MTYQLTHQNQRENYFQELFDFRRDFEQIFNRFLGQPGMRGGQGHIATGFAPAVESFIDRDTKKFHCQVMLPGIDPKDVHIDLQGNTLTISGERSETRETNEADYLQREISYGVFQRNVLIPEGVDKEKLTAEYRNGMLEITAPVAANALPRKVEIKSLPAQAARHATA